MFIIQLVIIELLVIFLLTRFEAATTSHKRSTQDSHINANVHAIFVPTPIPTCQSPKQKIRETFFWRWEKQNDAGDGG